MKAAVYYAMDDVRVEERPIPQISDDEILLKMLACGLCGGEAMPWYKKAQPKVLGHEPIGEVVELGSKVTGTKAGERLFVHHHVASMSSHWSRRGNFTCDPHFEATNIVPGGVCEYFKISQEHLEKDCFALPEDMDTAVATTIEPWACVIGGLKQCFVQPGDTVAVVGCGFMGQGFVHLAPLFGAGRVVALDLSDWRLKRALELGASQVINPESDDPVSVLRDCNDGLLADVAVAAAPSKGAWEQARALVGRGGTLHLGAPLEPGTPWTQDGADAYFGEVKITSKFSADHRDTYQCFRLLKAGRISPERAITHRFSIGKAPEAFRMLVDAQESLKIVMQP